jgi:hypothetical protein
MMARQRGTPCLRGRSIDDGIQQANDTAAKAEQTARETADQARKVAAQFAMATFIAMLIGTLSSSCGTAMGGRARDRSAARSH